MAKISEVIIKLSNVSKMKNMSEEELLSFVSKTDVCKIPKRLANRYDVKEEEINGSLCYSLSPKDNKSEKAVLFIHGGAYILEMDNYHWHAVDGIIKKTKATVYVPIYPLAPAHKHRETETFMKMVYEKIRKNYKEVYFIGDSAGGQIAIKLATESETKPKKLILVSPLIYLNPDKRLIEEMKALENQDIMLSTGFIKIVSKWWTGDEEHVYGDFGDLKNVNIFVGTEEILYPQAKRFAEEQRNCRIYEGNGLMHTWPYMPGDKACMEGFNKLCDIING